MKKVFVLVSCSTKEFININIENYDELEGILNICVIGES